MFSKAQNCFKNQENSI